VYVMALSLGVHSVDWLETFCTRQAGTAKIND
jgi:hypothetical protein